MENQKLTKSDIKRACDILRMDDGVGANNYVEQLSWLLFLKIFEGIEEELEELVTAEGKKYVQIIDPEFRWSKWAKKNWEDKDEIIYFINHNLFPFLKNLKGSLEKEKISEIFREITNRIISPHTILDTIDILDSISMSQYQDTHLLSQVYEEILQEMGSEGGWSGEFYTPRPLIRQIIKIVNPKLGEKIFDPFVGSGGFLVESFEFLKKQNPQLGLDEWEVLQKGTFFGQEKKPLPFLIGNMNMILHQIFVPNLVRTNTLMQDILNISENEKVDIIMTNPPFGGKENKSVQNNFPVQTQATEGLALQYVMRKLKNGGRCGIILPEGEILFGGGAFQKIREELLSKFNVHTIISLPQGTFAQMGAGVKTNLVFFEKIGPTKEIWYGEVEGKYTKKKTILDNDFEKIYKLWLKRETSENSWIVPITEIKKNKDFDISPKNPNKNSEVILIDAKLLIENIIENQKEINQIIENIKNKI